MIGLLTLAMLSLAALPAARVGEHTISMAEVDAATAGRADALQAKLAEVVTAAVWREVDRQLAVADPDPAPRAVADDDLARRRSEVTSTTLEGEELDAALRWQIEAERRRADRAAAANAARRAAHVSIEVPPDAELASELDSDRVLARGRDVLVLGHHVESTDAVRLYRLRGELHRERSRALDERIEATLLEGEARRRGISLEALLPPIVVAEDDLQAYIAEQSARGRTGFEAAQVEPLLRARAAHAARTALLDELRSRTKVEIHIAPPAHPNLDGSDSGAPTIGNRADEPTATIVAFADYRSAASRRVHAALDEVIAARPDVRVELRDFIVGYDPGVRQAASLVRCAPEGAALAAVRSEILSASPPGVGHEWYDAKERRAVAARAGVDAEALERCFAADETSVSIDRDTAAALALGFERPPALLVDGFPLSGVQSADTIRGLLDGDDLPGR